MILFIFFFFLADSYTTDEVVLVKKIKIYRSRLRHELVDVVQDPNILHFSINATVIDQRGKEEERIGDGVMRDVIFTFIILLPCIWWVVRWKSRQIVTIWVCNNEIQ